MSGKNAGEKAYTERDEKFSNKMRPLYDQCQEAYDKCKDQTGSSINNMPSPDPFNNEYNVPSELLFCELCKYDSAWSEKYFDFKLKLLEWVYHAKKWDFKKFVHQTKQHYQCKRYDIYLELYYKRGNIKSRPFSNPIKINDTLISWCSQREYRKIFQKYISTEQKRRDDSKMQYLKTTLDIRSFRRFPRLNSIEEKRICPIKITVYSFSTYCATASALEKMEVLMNCLNVAQGIQKYSVSLSGGSSNNLGSKTVFFNTGHYLVVGEDDMKVFYTGNPIIRLPNNSFDLKKYKRKTFRDLLKGATQDCCVSDRIRCVLRDLALAYDSTNAGVKTLSYWRCLEHTTRSKSKNRREKDIINIFKNMYQYKHWKQMGDLVQKARNQYVHSGLYAGEDRYIDQYVNWSQWYAEQSLRLLLDLFVKRDAFKNEEELDAFFDNYAESDEYLKAVNRMYNFRKKNK